MGEVWHHDCDCKRSIEPWHEFYHTVLPFMQLFLPAMECGEHNLIANLIMDLC